MARSLIITPFDYVYLAGYQEGSDTRSREDHTPRVDTTYFFLSAIAMSGVDYIYSMTSLFNTYSKLVRSKVKDDLIHDWFKCFQQVNGSFNNFRSPKMSKRQQHSLFFYEVTTMQLLFALKNNSSVLIIKSLDSLVDEQSVSPELKLPYDFLRKSTQFNYAQLPIVRYDMQKKDIRKLLDVIASKEFESYKEAHSEIERTNKLTSKVIRPIEAAAKDLLKKNTDLLCSRESVLKAIPLIPEVIESFFGKLPGVLAEQSGKLLTDYLKSKRSIPIYSADSISRLLSSYV